MAASRHVLQFYYETVALQSRVLPQCSINNSILWQFKLNRSCYTPLCSAYQKNLTNKMIQKCSLCTVAVATVFCVNDDAALCTSCDTKFHNNPIASRHVRRPLESAHICSTSGTSNSHEDHAVPQFPAATTAVEISSKPIQTAPFTNLFDDIFPMPPSFVGDDDLFSAAVDINPIPSSTDLLDFDFDCIVPSLPENELQTGPFMLHESATATAASPLSPTPVDPLIKSQCSRSTSNRMVPQFFSTNDNDDAFTDEEEEPEEDPTDVDFCVATRRSGAYRARRDTLRTVASTVASDLYYDTEPALTREQRVARYKQKRARRTFRKTIRYQSRKAYAEIRPRIKGRFVSPEEYAAWKAQQDAVVPSC